MNATVRAVVRSAIRKDWEAYGIRSGFAGLLKKDFIPLGSRDVSGIIQQGGTVLRSARCEEFVQPDAQSMAADILERQGISGLVVIGGNGSLAGAHCLSGRGLAVIGIGATIDNDVLGADVAIGVDTALNIALEAIDRLKVTAASHERAFLVEVMGKDSGYLALVAAIAGGAEMVVIPEADIEPEAVAEELRRAYDRGHAHAIAVIAEGAHHDADSLAQYFQQNQADLGFQLRVTKLGHVQRGGAPGVFDRLLGTRLGAAACDFLDNDVHAVSLGIVGGKIIATPLFDITLDTKSLDPELMRLSRVLVD